MSETLWTVFVFFLGYATRVVVGYIRYRVGLRSMERRFNEQQRERHQ